MKIVETQEQTVSISQGLTKKFFLHLKGSGDSIILFLYLLCMSALFQICRKIFYTNRNYIHAAKIAQPRNHQWCFHTN